jgi:signal transduction histidine kinase
LSGTGDQLPAALAALFESLDEGLLVLDQRGRIRYCNRAAGEMLRVDPARVLGQDPGVAFRHFDTLVAYLPNMQAQWRDALERVDERPSFEFATRTERGERQIRTTVFRIGAGPIGSTGPAGGWLDSLIGVALRDVTAEHTLDRERAYFVSMVSHEMRSPLTMIVGYAELLVRSTLPPDRLRDVFSIISHEAARLTKLVQDILEVQRLEMGEVRLTLAPLDVTGLLATVASRHNETAKTHPVYAHLPAGLPLVLADQDRVRQVLDNLVSNAMKYSPPGAGIRLAARSEGEMVRILVADRGMGIPKDALPRLFDRFYRVPGTARSGVTGYGLGLVVVKMIVEKHGGSVDVQSQPGVGSTFSFTIPVAPPPDAAPSEPQPAREQ